MDTTHSLQAMRDDQNPYKDRREAIQDWKDLANTLCVENDKIIEFAETLFNKGIKVKDALHIACAVDSIVMKKDYFCNVVNKLKTRRSVVKT